MRLPNALLRVLFYVFLSKLSACVLLISGHHDYPVRKMTKTFAWSNGAEVERINVEQE